MQLYIGGLPDNTAEDEVISLFSKIGTVESVQVIRDIGSSKSKGFAIVRMPNDAEGEEAIRKLNGLMLADRQVLVARMHETLPGEMEFREWLRDNADEVLNKAGVREGQTLVDYGCGPGIFSIAAAKIVGRQGKVYALDIRPRALSRLKEIAMEDGLPNLKTMLIDKLTVSVALSDGVADVVLLYDVLQEIQDKPRLMAELYRILKPSGVLSVFPMHLGTSKLLDLVDAIGLFQTRDRYSTSGFESASEIVNLTKRRP
jgi:SAM-dependent methyltransferase